MNRKFPWKNLLFIIFGSLSLSIAVSYFILPFKILAGGVAGLSVALSVLLHLHPDFLVNFLMIFLFVIGFVFLGKKFLVNTLLSSVLYLLFVNCFNAFPLDWYIEPVLASLYAGIFTGIGIALVVLAGGSTGGMDIPPLIIHKYTGIKVSLLVLIVDCTSILLGLLSYGLREVLIGFISVYACSFMIDKIVSMHAKKRKFIHIVSDHVKSIDRMLQKEFHSVTTVLETNHEVHYDQKEVLFVSLDLHCYPHVMKRIQEIDTKAILIVQDMDEIDERKLSLHEGGNG